MAWSAKSGQALWSISNNKEARTQLCVANSATLQSTFVLTGEHLKKVRTPDGALEWDISLELGAGSLTQMTSYAETVYIVSTQKSPENDRNMLSVSQVDSGTGKFLGSTSVGMLDGEDRNTFYLSKDGALPLLIWADSESNTILVSILERQEKSIRLVSKQRFDQFTVHYDGLPTSVILYIQYTDHKGSSWEVVYTIDLVTQSIQKEYSLPAISLPSLAEVTKWQDKIYIVRVSKDEFVGHMEIWDSVSHDMIAFYEVQDIAATSGHLQSLSVEVSRDAVTDEIVARAMLSTSDGLISMWRSSSVDWVRDEGLADVERIILVELPEPQSLKAITQSEQDPIRNFISRIRRHLAEAFSSLIKGNATADSLIHALPQRDHFGLRQYAIAMGSSGRLWALDTFGPKTIAWTSALSLPRAIHVDAWLHDSSDDANTMLPRLDILVHQDEVYYLVQLDALTGSELSVKELPEGYRTRTSKPFDRMADLSISANYVDATILQHRKSIGSWRFDAPPGQRIVANSQPIFSEAVASVGRVLGDRGVMYKYLNKESIALLTVDDVAHTLTLWYLDGINGTILYKATHQDVGTARDVQLLVSENWIAYHFWKDGDTKAYEMVIVELYEGPRNLRRSPDREIIGVAQSFIYDHSISAMTATTSKQGITSRDIIVALHSSGITTISRRLLDPRRPTAEKLSADDKEEMLIPYDSIIPNDPKTILSHTNDVIGIKKIITGPTLLESTALVCAFGLDIFFTRVTPSMPYDILSDSFSKSQIGISLFVLCAAIAFTRPMAAKKSLERRWIG